MRKMGRVGPMGKMGRVRKMGRVVRVGRGLVLLLFVLSSASARSVPLALSVPPDLLVQVKPKRPFPPQDLGLLEGPDRDAWQRPDQVMDALGIGEGSVVADLGAGGGWFTIRLARRVGPHGIVYAEDIQTPMLDAIGRRVQREGLTNVRPVLGTGDDPKLPRNLDVILIVGTYHEMDNPVALLQNAAPSLKPQGRLGVVDFTMGGGGPGPARDERVDPEQVIKAAATAGLRLLKRESVLPFQYLLVFGKS